MKFLDVSYGVFVTFLRDRGAEMMFPETALDAKAIQQQLSRILRSRVFERAQRSQRLLRYVVDAALAEPPIVVKEYTIAMDVFDREASYDPSVDATVRVEASRLRSRLREFYDEEGREDPWLIEVPKGAYVAVFTVRAPVSAAPSLPETSAAVSAAGPAPVRFQSVAGEWRGRLYLGLAAALLVLTVGVAALHWRAARRHAGPKATAPLSLAILPIANQTGDPGLNPLMDGLTDDLIRQLSQVPALRLIARTTTFRYRDQSGDAGAVGRALHVDVVMAGELRRNAEHTVLAMEVSRAGDGSVLLDRQYIADEGDLRVLQADIQHDVLEKLDVEDSALDPERGPQRVTSSPEAYTEFLKGDALAGNNVPAALEEALGHFEAAVRLDPQFDLAWTNLASTHVLLGVYFEPPRDHMPLARAYAQRALQINPREGEAHGDLGLIDLVYDWNVPAAQTEMDAADAEAAAIGKLACTVHLVGLTGRSRTAEEILSRMLAFDPQSGPLTSELGCVNYYRGDYDAALRHYRDAVRVDPQSPVSYWGLGKTLNAQGRYAEAIGAVASFQQKYGFEPPLLTAEVGYSLGASGKREQALQTARKLMGEGQKIYVDPYFIAEIFASMNDRESAFLWLDKAVKVRSPFVSSLTTEPKWKNFQTDPRFVQVLEHMAHAPAADTPGQRAAG